MIKEANRLIGYTRKSIFSEEFMQKFRLKASYFARIQKLLPFSRVALIVLNMVKKAIENEIMNYIDKVGEKGKAPTRQAFSKARDKISYLAFKDFFDKSCELAINDEDGEAKRYKGYRLLANDGSTFIVGDMEIKSIKDYFGESTSVKGKAMCRIGAVVDVLNNCIVGALVTGYKTGERALAIQQIKAFKAIDRVLHLFDRGYWSPELIKEIDANGQKFLMRLPSNVKNTTVKDENGNEIKLRKHSFVLPGGDVETLLTNLSAEEVSDEELSELYMMRWGAETKYLELKARLDIDSFSGQSANTVLQDIFATLYISNLTAFLCGEADEIIDERTANKNNKYKQIAKRSFCISVLRSRFIAICVMPDPLLRASELNRLVEDISCKVTYVDKSKPRDRDKRQMKNSRSFIKLKSVL